MWKVQRVIVQKKKKKKQVKTNDGHSKEELQKKTVHPSEDVS